MDPIKAEQLSSRKWRILSLPFGGPNKGKDYDGEYFSVRTNPWAEYFPEHPVLFHHGKDRVLKDTVVGIEDELHKEIDGWWGTLWLERGNQYLDQINALIAAGKAWGSSGSVGHLVKKAPDGELLVWPHIEQTITTMPRNHFSVIVPTKAATDFTNAGLTWTEPDLGPDLSSDGDGSAMARLTQALEELEGLIKNR